VISAAKSRKKQIEFTAKEIEALFGLIAIAVAGPENEGDYAGFDYKAMERARLKLVELHQHLSKRELVKRGRLRADSAAGLCPDQDQQ
jgi:hypothetical protein